MAKIFLFLLALVWALPPCRAFCAEVELKFGFAAYGEKILAAAFCDISPDYHAYAHNPGAAGKPSNLKFTLEGQGDMPVLYPPGTREKDIFDPSQSVYVYNGRVMFLAILPAGSSGAFYAASLDMLLCSKRHCMPVKQSLTGHAPKKIPPLADLPWASEAKKLLASQGDSIGAISLEEGQAPPPLKSAGLEEKRNEEEAESRVGESGIAAPEDFDFELQPRYAGAAMEVYSLGQALLVGLLAGLLLNAMPCVLPVLTFKVAGLVFMGGNKEKIRNFRQHNLCFAAGVLTFFTCLALLLGLADLMWGQLYQSQPLLLLMLVLVFLMGLSMLGVFSLPVLDLRLGENTANPMLKSYCSGLISTFLATPCSGPLLGGALAWAFTQSIPCLIAVFWAVGIGMALPYFAFSIWPSMARILPRPGAWMEIFERVMGFLLLGTSLYLLSILPADKYLRILMLLLLAAACAWMWGRFCNPGAPRARRRLGALAGCALLCLAMAWALKQPQPAPEWKNFSPSEFAEALGEKPLLVEFTADWCPNCKFLEATTLGAGNLRTWKKRYGLELIRVDLTRPNAYGERLLSMLGGKSIPLTAIFPTGPSASRPLVLRDLYGKSGMSEALAAAFDKS